MKEMAESLYCPPTPFKPVLQYEPEKKITIFNQVLTYLSKNHIPYDLKQPLPILKCSLLSHQGYWSLCEIQVSLHTTTVSWIKIAPKTNKPHHLTQRIDNSEIIHIRFLN